MLYIWSMILRFPGFPGKNAGKSEEVLSQGYIFPQGAKLRAAALLIFQKNKALRIILLQQ